MKRALRAAGSVLRGAFWALLLLALLGSLLLLRAVWAARSRERLSRIDAAPHTGHFVKAGDVDLFVQEAGPERGPAVLLIHGLAGWSGTWKDALDALAARKLHAIAVDMPPLGYSERPADASYSDAAQARRLLAALDALRVQRTAVVGHSFGARAAVALALQAPGRVSKLVLVDAALPPPGSEGREPPPWARRILAAAPLRDALLAATLANPVHTRRIMTFFTADPACATDERVEAMARPLAVEGTVAAFGRFLQAVSVSARAPDYARLKAPTLLLWGEADTATPLAGAAALEAVIKGAKLRVIPGAGHLLPLEKPAEFDAALLDFLAGKNVLASGHETHRAPGPSGPRSSR